MSSVGTGFGQWGAGPNGEPIIQRTIVPLTGYVGQILQLEYADIYEDGSGEGLSNPGTWWSLAPNILSVSSSGLATCVAPGQAPIGTILNGAIFAQGIFVVTVAQLVSIAIEGNQSTLPQGSTEQLKAIGTYSDGTTRDITTDVTWSTSGPVAAVDSTGLVTALIVGTVTIYATQGSVSASVPLQVLFVDPPEFPGVPYFKSHLTQVLQNYFDYNDARVRRGRYTIDAQLLNLAAQQMEQTSLRLSREVAATTLRDCPTNIDNNGVYWKQRLPVSFNYALPAHSVSAVRGSAQLDLSLYDDQVPVPSRIEINSSIDPVVLSNTRLFSVGGIGDTAHQAWSIQRVGPFSPQFPGRLNFWIDTPSYYGINVRVRIIGQRAPVPAWADTRTTSSELIKLNSLGWAESKFAWSTIELVEILGLPVGVTISAYTGKFELPMQPDVSRPYTDHAYRDVSFDRYWSIEPGFLFEQYLASDFNGFRFVNSYVAPNISAIALEPHTWGMFVAQGTVLYYVDRREPLPQQLGSTAITQEPLYGLDIIVDETQLTPVRFVVLNPVAYSKAGTVLRWRYTVLTPDGKQYVVTPDGFFADYTGTAGWRTGIPPALTLPLAQTGTYVFSIQAAGPDGNVVNDSYPWPNFALRPKATIDISNLVSVVKGLSYDNRGRLWVWDGSIALPLKIHYDAYVIDEETQAMYLTDPVDGLIVDGLAL